MASCPNCQNQVGEGDKFCSQCGVGLVPGAPDAVWMAAAREKIKRAKENDLTYTILGVVGVVAAIAIPFIMRFVLGFSMDTFSWLLTAVGILFFIGGYLGTWYNGRKVKGLIEQMEKGPGKADTGDDAR